MRRRPAWSGSRSTRARWYHDLLAMSMRDYQAGYADRAGLYLLEFLRKLAEEPDYDRNFSGDSQRALARYVVDLREL